MIPHSDKNRLPDAVGGKARGLLCALALVVVCPALAPGADDATGGAELDIDIAGASIEELLNIPLTSYNKRPEFPMRIPAAISVLSGEDIRRAGVRTIPDALRLIPGVEVAQVDASKFAVTMRGFNSRSANKLLVMIDGRSVYDQLFSEVFWEVQDVVLEDIERIEVIRGPGGAVWGANAVNGVINIITKSADATVGQLAVFGAGSEERVFGTLRTGARVNDKLALRAYSKYSRRDEGYSRPPTKAVDGWDMLRGGMRGDWRPSDRIDVTFHGDVYSGQAGEPLTPLAGLGASQQVGLGGGNLVIGLTRKLAREQALAFNVYYDYTDYDNLLLRQRRHTFNLDAVHHATIGARNRLTWGPTYRVTTDRIRNSSLIGLSPTERTDNLIGVFAQDEITLLPAYLDLSLGSKLEHNDYSGVEIQPTVRLSGYPRDNHTVWSAASRAVRTPSRLEEDLVVPSLGFDANRGFDSEVLWAFEAGYRAAIVPQLGIAVATFYNVYDRLLSLEGLTLGNKLAAKTMGAELRVLYQPLKALTLHAGYTAFSMAVTKDASSLTPAASLTTLEGADPAQQGFLVASYTPHADWQFDGVLRATGELPALAVDAYAALDLRASWRFYRDFFLTLVGRNLLQAHHAEQAGQATQVQRSVFGQVEWRH